MPDLSTFLRQSSLTFSDCQTDCFNYINSLPDGSKPKDLFKGSEGRLIIDYLCAFHSDIAYKIIMGFCENYLIYANKIENIIANAESKGYNVSRGTNIRLLCTFIPNIDQTIGYLSRVGDLEEYGLYSLESKQVNAGETTTLEVVVGNRNRLSYTVDDINLLAYRLTAPNISDDIRVSIDESDPDNVKNVVDYSTDPIQALYGSLVVMTNSYGSVDILDFSNLSKFSVSKEAIYTGSYQLINNSYYTYKLSDDISGTVVYSQEPLAINTVLYEDIACTVVYGTVNSISQVGTEIFIDVIGNHTYLGRCQEFNIYYTYRLGDRDYYTKESIKIGLNVYEDPSFLSLYGNVTSLYTDTNICVISTATNISERDYNIVQGSIIYLDYITLENIQYSGANGNFNIGTLTNVVQLTAGSSVESALSVQQNAILHEQTRNTLVARRDAKKLVKLSKKIVPGILNTNDYDYSPSTVAVTYVLDSMLPMTDTQLIELNNSLSESRAAGIPMPYIVNSFNVDMKLNVNISTSQIVESSSLQNSVDEIFNKYNKNPGITIKFDEIERKIEKINSVETTRFIPISSAWSEGDYLSLGSFIIDTANSNAFLAATYNYRSGATEPTWSTDGESLVTDGELMLKPVRWQYASTWSANNIMYVGQMINPTVANGYTYEVVQVANYTSILEPIGAGVDGDIVWSLTSYDSQAPNWTAETLINYGDIVNVSSLTTYSLVASGFRRRMGTEPVWSNYKTELNVDSDTIRFIRIPLAVTDLGGLNPVSSIAKGAILQLPWNCYLNSTQTIV